MRKVLVPLLSALVVFLAGSAWLALYPVVPPDLGGAPDLDAHATHVSIPVGEGDALDGWWLQGTRPGTIVLFHGYARDHRRMWRYANFLRRDGWSLLAVDFRSSREHDRKPTTLGWWESRDAEAVLAWLATHPSPRGGRLGLFGESLGGSVALTVGAQHPEVAAIAVDSPFADGKRAIADGFRFVAHVPPWPAAPLARLLARAVTGHDPAALAVVPAVHALGARPLLLIQSGIEDRFGRDEVRDLEAAAGPGAQRWLVPDAGHNQAWIKHRTEYEACVRRFFVGTMSPVPAPAARRAATAAASHGRRTHPLHKPSGVPS